MTYEEIKQSILNLSEKERNRLILEVNIKEDLPGSLESVLSIRRDKLNNKQGVCPYCNHAHYVRFGVEKGSQRYRCKACKKTFTEYTGTWLAKLHKKHLADSYLELMKGKNSLDKIKAKLGINKKTAFDWRHKILSSVEQIRKDKFDGITESDDTFFRLSEKGRKQNSRLPRKRGKSLHKRGINNDHVAVIVTADRKKNMDLTVATLGRIKKSDIKKAIDERIKQNTILCSDSHVSYKGYATDKGIEHHTIRADLNEFVKSKIYHVQHVNGIDSRLKKWIENDFNGVSTKYLQKYLNWFRMKEMLKSSKDFITDLKQIIIEDTQALERFNEIDRQYQLLLQKTT